MVWTTIRLNMVLKHSDRTSDATFTHFYMAHACPERRFNPKKCPRTNESIPIFAKTVQTREVIPNFFHRALFEKASF